ncbi:MAG: MBL fold metallo-hydrolase [Methyloligellaceae bacterium]
MTDIQGLQPGIMRRKIGSIEVTALLDGYGKADNELLVGFDAERAREIRKTAFLPETGPIAMPVSTFLVNTGQELILIDAGASETWNPNMGKLAQMLQLAGVRPEQITKLLITHMHPDHILGAVTGTGEAFFPNAELVLSEIEHAFWTNDNYVTPDRKAVFDMARSVLAAYRERLKFIQDGQEIITGIQAVALPGHTPGHTGYMISSDQDSLFVAGDIVHLCALQFAEPGWAVIFDADKNQAIDTRKKALDQAATDRQLITGMHMPFPGFGYAERNGNGYRFVPADWQYY